MALAGIKHAGTTDPSTITITVYNSITPEPKKIYTTTIVERGVLLGAMKRLSKNTDFRFEVKENDDYGPFLTTINGVSGDDKQRTYWQFLVEDAHGKEITPDVGIGCYIPNANDCITFKFTHYP